MTALKSVAATRTPEVVKVTPTKAAEWLAKNVKNRNISQMTVEIYARDMRNGDWHFTGEPIKFDALGNLVDGQHRCLAIIRSETSQPMVVVYGLATAAQDVMDSGKKRTAGDMLALQGYANANTLASTARLGFIIESGRRKGTGGAPVSKSQIGQYIAANPDLVDACTASSTIAKYVPFSPTALAYSWLTLARVDETECAAFFDSLANNATKGKGDPRNTLLRRMNSAKRADERLSADDQVQFIVRAWNAHRKGADLHVLKTRSVGADDAAIRVSIPKAV